MARKPRREYPGAIDHVMNRDDRREAIFPDDGDQAWFVATLAELVTRRKGDGAKWKRGADLRARTARTWKWIAARLQMGTGASLSDVLPAPWQGER